MRHTFLVVCLLQPLSTEERPRQSIIPFLDDQRLPALDDMELNKLFELALTNVTDLRSRNALDPVKVGGSFDQRMEVQVWRDRVELRLRMQRGRHFGSLLATVFLGGDLVDTSHVERDVVAFTCPQYVGKKYRISKI